MKRKDKNFILSVLFLSLCIGLTGCGNKQTTDTSATLEESEDKTPTLVITLPVIPGEEDNGNLPDNDEVSEPNEINNSEINIPKGEDEDSMQVNDTIFTETSETVYATTNVNIRSSYTTEQDNVISVLHKGDSIKQIGIQEEWSKVLYNNNIGYIKAEYLSLNKPAKEETLPPTPELTVTPTATKAPSSSDTSSGNNPTTDNDTDNPENESFVAKLDISTELNQLICVIGNGGADCTVSFHIKDENGKWIQQFSIDGDCGSKGITYNKKEGDSKTPAGLYSFTTAFGIKSDPGAQLSYRQVTEYDYWIDDVDSPYYNTWVNSLEIPGDYESEHLIDHAPQYNYAININYNSKNTPGLGSAIFLHGYNGKGKTTGCIAIAEKYVKELVRKVDSSTKILILPDSDDLAKY